MAVHNRGALELNCIEISMTSEKYISTIQKSQQEALSPVEMRELDQWQKAYDADGVIRKDVEELWTQLDDYPFEFELDYDKEYAAIQSVITSQANAEAKVVDLTKSNTSKPKIRRMSIGWGVAASFLAVLATLLLWDTGNDTNLKATYANQEVVLPDGSRVQLDQGSEIVFDQDWSKERKLSFKGSAYFDIEHDPSKPLTILGDGSNVKVLGTKFMYSTVAGKGYLDLFQGQVELQHAGKKVSMDADLQNKTYTFANDQIATSSRNKDQYSWYQPKFVFKQDALSEIVDYISEWNDQEVLLSPQLHDCKLTGSFESLSSIEVLEQIATLYHAKLERVNSQLIITGGSCQ